MSSHLEINCHYTLESLSRSKTVMNPPPSKKLQPLVQVAIYPYETRPH